MPLDRFTHEEFGHVGLLYSPEVSELGGLVHDFGNHFGLCVDWAACLLVDEFALHDCSLHVVEFLWLLTCNWDEVALLAIHLQEAPVLGAGETAARIHHTIATAQTAPTIALCRLENWGERSISGKEGYIGCPRRLKLSLEITHLLKGPPCNHSGSCCIAKTQTYPTLFLHLTFAEAFTFSTIQLDSAPTLLIKPESHWCADSGSNFCSQFVSHANLSHLSYA